MKRNFFPFLIFFLVMGCGTTHYKYIHRDFPCHPEYRPSGKRLFEKANVLEKNLHKFLPPDGLLVYYRTRPPFSPPEKGKYGNKSDGPIWTGALLGAEALRYSVTGSEEALEKVKKLINGLHLLQAVTGVPGLMARFYDYGTGPNPSEQNHPDWRQGRGKYARYRYKTDVSKDQYTGVLFGYSVAYTLLKKHPNLRAIIRSDTLRIADFLIKNGYRIIDEEGKVTTFGDLRGRIFGAPIYLNALICLHTIALAREVSDHAPRYEEEWKKLLRWKYHKIIHNSKFQIFGNTNPNNDNMAFLCYYGLYLLLPEGEVREEVKKSARYLWSFIKAEGNSFWNFAYFALCEIDKLSLKDALRNLDLFPPHNRGYTVDSRQIKEIERDFWKGRGEKLKAKYPVPLNLRGMSAFIWKSSPYIIYAPEEPGIEYSGADYLLAYWLGRYHGYIGEGR